MAGKPWPGLQWGFSAQHYWHLGWIILHSGGLAYVVHWQDPWLLPMRCQEHPLNGENPNHCPGRQQWLPVENHWPQLISRRDLWNYQLSSAQGTDGTATWGCQNIQAIHLNKSICPRLLLTTLERKNIIREGRSAEGKGQRPKPDSPAYHLPEGQLALNPAEVFPGPGMPAPVRQLLPHPKGL